MFTNILDAFLSLNISTLNSLVLKELLSFQFLLLVFLIMLLINHLYLSKYVSIIVNFLAALHFWYRIAYEDYSCILS